MKSILLVLCGVCVCFFPSNTDATEPPITSILFTPDSKAVVACSQAGLLVYSWPNLKLNKTIQTNAVNIHEIAFAPTGKQLAIGGGSPGKVGVVEIISWPEGKSLRVLKTKQVDSVMAVAWRNDSVLASASLDRSIWLWDVNNGTALRELKGHSGGVTSLCFLPGKKTLVSAGIDRSLRVWDVDSGELIRSMDNHTMPVYGLAVRPTKNGLPMVASVSKDKTVRLWQPTIGRMVRFARLKSKPLGVGWVRDGTKVLACCTDGCVRVVDPDTVTITREIPALAGWAYTLAVHPSDRSIVVAGQNGELRRILLQPTKR